MVYQTVGETLRLKSATNSLNDLMALARQGLRKTAMDALAERLECSTQDLVAYLPISARTLQRYNLDTQLSTELSDRIIQIAKVYARAVEVFGDRNKAVAWLKYPNHALGGVTPLSCLDNFSGIEIVLDELGRIEYGVYA